MQAHRTQTGREFDYARFSLLPLGSVSKNTRTALEESQALCWDCSDLYRVVIVNSSSHKTVVTMDNYLIWSISWPFLQTEPNVTVDLNAGTNNLCAVAPRSTSCAMNPGDNPCHNCLIRNGDESETIFGPFLSAIALSIQEQTF